MKPGVIKVKVNPDLCQGCRACESICSVFHLGVVNPAATGIKIEEKEKLGHFKQTVCQQCIDMVCAEACPVNAISRDSFTGAVVIGDNCIGCGKCAEACPIDAINMIEVEGKNLAFKCDLCGGVPECVKICPRNALGW